MQVTFVYKKSLGQNFIYDTAFLQAMVKDLAIQPTDLVVEVGTGAGTLTKVLAAYGCQVQTIEIDKRLQPLLEKELLPLPNVKLIFGDALQYDFRALPNFRLIANVPYYITTPLMMQFLMLPNCTDLHILVASEVAERVVAPVGTPEYGALSVVCQLLADCKITKLVPRTMFTPQPKVDSAFISLKKKTQTLPINFNRLLKGIFAARRKTILNALGQALRIDKTLAAAILAAAQINPDLRPEQITPTQYAQISVLALKYDK